MTAAARRQAEAIGKHLECRGRFSINYVRDNHKALIADPMALVEQTLDVISAARSVEHEVNLLLNQSMGIRELLDRRPEVEAQKQRAIEAAKRFEAALEAAPPCSASRVPQALNRCDD